jgi:tetratricopeptide (TPR) repeat protein
VGMEEESKRVLELMTFWVSKIKADNYLDFYDINRLSEDLALKLLNEIYNLNLENLNREKRNYPGIDLGDKTRKIAYQITSRDDPQKIKKCIEAFDKEDKTMYPGGIRFLILNDNKPKVTGKKWLGNYKYFNPDEHIITHHDLIGTTRQLYHRDRERFNRIKDILEEEIAIKGLKNGKEKVKQKQIKILSITASPQGVDSINYENEQDIMLEAFKSFDREEVFLDMPDPVQSTLTEIADHLHDGKHDILHITAHGGINEKGEGLLNLEDRWGNLQEVTGELLLRSLVPSPRIVILSAYHSARQEPGLMPAALEKPDREKLKDLSLLECIAAPGGDLYYVHRLTAQYVLNRMEGAVEKKYHTRAARYFENRKDEEGKVDLYDHIEARWHYLQAGEWDKAADITFDLEKDLTLHGFPQWSMELLQELDIKKINARAQSVVYIRIGNLYINFGKYENALSHYNKACEIAKKNNDSINESHSLHQVGNIYYLKGDYDEALKQYQKSMEIKEKIGDIYGLALSMGQMGSLYLQKKEFANALEFFIRALLIFTKIGSPYANQARKDIEKTRENLTEKQFNDILKKFKVEL